MLSLLIEAWFETLKKTRGKIALILAVILGEGILAIWPERTWIALAIAFAFYLVEVFFLIIAEVLEAIAISEEYGDYY